MSVTSEDISRVLKAVPTELLIGGSWVAGEDTLDVEDPSTGEVLTSVADASPEQGIDALNAAVAAADSWKQTDPRERGEILRRAFTLITERADDIALLMTLEMGKPLSESHAEVTYGAEFFRWFSEEAVRVSGRYAVAPSGGTRLLTMKQPVGPVYAITPWNFPLAMGTRKLGPAVAAGCTVVIKPAAQTRSPRWRWLEFSPRRACQTVCSMWSRHPTPARFHHRSSLIRGFASSHSPVRRRLVGGSSSNRRSRCSRRRWSWAAMLPSLCSQMRTSTRPWMARCWPRCAISARPARRPTAFWCMSRWPATSRVV